MKSRSIFHRNSISALLLLIFQCRVLFAMGQASGIPASMSKPKARFGLDVAGDLNFLTWPQSMGSRHQPAVGFSTHIWGRFPFGRKLGLQFGIGYALRRNNLAWNNAIFSSDIDPQLGQITYSQVDAQFVAHELQVLAMLKYYFSSPENGFFLGAGPILSFGQAQHTKGVIHFGNGTTENLDLWSRPAPTNLGLQACVGHVLQLGPALRLGVEIYGTRYFEKLEPFISRPCVLGLRLNYWF